MRTLILILFFPALCHSQILTQKDNDRWFDSLATLSLPQQVQFIQERAISDTSFSDTGEGKPVFAIGITNGFTYWGNHPFKENLLRFQEILQQVKIDRIVILRNATATALYGSDAHYGVVICMVTDKKSKHFLKQIKQSRR